MAGPPDGGAKRGRGGNTLVISSFKDLARDQGPFAGGKGRTLATLYRARYPVLDGLVILTAAFAGDDLRTEAWALGQAHLARLRRRSHDQGCAFAVRSCKPG